MREESRPGAPRPSRAPGKPGPGAQARPSGPARPAPRPNASQHGASQHGASQHGASQRAAATARLTKVIEPVLAAMEIDLEAVKLSSAGRRTVLRIVIDADGGISLDDIAEVSREVSAKLDAKDTMGEEPYTLEVTSPGVDRPLTQPRHWRRAAGRLVIAPLTGGDDEIKGRIIDADQDRVTLEVDGDRRSFGFGELGPGRVQVEFGRLDEIDDVGPDEEELDGH